MLIAALLFPFSIAPLAPVQPYRQPNPTNQTTVASLDVSQFLVSSPQFPNMNQNYQTTVLEPAEAARKAQVVQSTTPAPIVRQTAPTAATDHITLMVEAGISPSDYQYVEFILNHESGWRTGATEPTTFAYGLCQALPGGKMASAGADWLTNPLTQLKWCDQYAHGSYGSWYGAYLHWISNRWW